MSNTSGLDETELSDLIGEIYDCVIDPARWDPTLERLRGCLMCTNCVLAVSDVRNRNVRFQKAVGIDPQWLARMPEYAADVGEWVASVPDMMTRPLDEPFVGRREISDEAWFNNRYSREWGAPQGIIDIIFIHLMRGSGHVAEIALGRHESFGLITDREVRLLRLLAPHLRRAVAISDLIDMKSIEANALGHTLDQFAAGVVLVTEDAEILHANRVAHRMLDLATPILSTGGRLSVADADTARELQAVLTAAARNEAQMGGAGVGMALTGHVGPPATAHVLPIAEGELRSRLLPQAAAAVFVSSEGEKPLMNVELVASIYGLSGAETRVLEQLVRGGSLADAASALFVSQNTAKTHLSRIFAKTGTKRQASLIALVNRLVPPLGSSDNS